MRCATLAARARSRSQTTRMNRSWARRSAVAAPIPPPPPVTTATFWSLSSTAMAALCQMLNGAVTGTRLVACDDQAVSHLHAAVENEQWVDVNRLNGVLPSHG